MGHFYILLMGLLRITGTKISLLVDVSIILFLFFKLGDQILYCCTINMESWSCLFTIWDHWNVVVN